MSADPGKLIELEQRARSLFEQSVSRVDVRVRSRLAAARWAAVEEIGAQRRSFWRGPVLVPATGALAAAAIVALVLASHMHGNRPLPPLDGAQSAEDIEMLSDREALDMIQGWDGGFYEWAVAQSGR